MYKIILKIISIQVKYKMKFFRGIELINVEIVSTHTNKYTTNTIIVDKLQKLKIINNHSSLQSKVLKGFNING